MPRTGTLSRWQASFERWHVPVLAGLVSAVLSTLVSQALAVREREQFALVMEPAARSVRAGIRAELDARMHALAMLAREWQDRFLPMRGGWESDVRLILSQSPGLQSIAWLEPNGRRSWVYPPDSNLPAIEPAALRVGVAGPVRGRDGAPWLRMLAPLVEEGEPRGWLEATYASRELFEEILASVDTTFAVRLSAGPVELFRNASVDSQPYGTSHTRIELPTGLVIDVAVEPSAEMLAAAHSLLPVVTLAGGLALSLLLALALGLRNIASQRARSLEAEIAGHASAAAEVRRLNAELEQRVSQRTDELVRSNENLKRFASFLSHELRQPLGTQMIWIELLESQTRGSLEPDAVRSLGNVRSSALKMAELITAQIELASPPNVGDDGAARVELAAVVRDAIADLTVQLEEIGAKVHVGTLPAVRGDARQLYQLFRNLLENAVKYRRSDVQTEIAISAEGNEICVEDNGRGFAREDAERIFEPSEQLDPTFDGQGLGLALCRTIVQRHGGELHGEGRPGQGAAFRLKLPEDRIYR
jgi:signal transduction histidine kinase